jgi:hypothetical protein
MRRLGLWLKQQRPSAVRSQFKGLDQSNRALTASGGNFVLDGTNDRREYGAASATGNHL